MRFSLNPDSDQNLHGKRQLYPHHCRIALSLCPVQLYYGLNLLLTLTTATRTEDAGTLQQVAKMRHRWAGEHISSHCDHTMFHLPDTGTATIEAIDIRSDARPKYIITGYTEQLLPEAEHWSVRTKGVNRSGEHLVLSSVFRLQIEIFGVRSTDQGRISCRIIFKRHGHLEVEAGEVMFLHLFVNLMGVRNKCNGNWIFTQWNICIKLFKEKKSWTDARSFCQDQGGDLILIESKDNNNYVTGLVGLQEDISFWIGLRHTQNKYLWVDYHYSVYRNWLPGLSKHNKDGYCVEMGLRGKGHWTSRLCDDHHFFICQRPQRFGYGAPMLLRLLKVLLITLSAITLCFTAVMFASLFIRMDLADRYYRWCETRRSSHRRVTEQQSFKASFEPKHDLGFKTISSSSHTMVNYTSDFVDRAVKKIRSTPL